MTFFTSVFKFSYFGNYTINCEEIFNNFFFNRIEGAQYIDISSKATVILHLYGREVERKEFLEGMPYSVASWVLHILLKYIYNY